MILRRFAWRLGRRLYMQARGDGPNVIHSNGEYLAQCEFVAWCARENKRATVFDVGANIGEWSMSLVEEARRCGALSLLDLHAFEPVEAAFRVLDSRCTTEAGARIVRRVQRAVSRMDGIADIHIVGSTAGTNSLHVDKMTPSVSVVQVRTCAADSYCKENGIAAVHFFKTDTEGNDLDVLLGAKALFDEERVSLFQFEYNHRWVYSRHYLKDVFDFADGRPYLVGKLTGKGIEVLNQWHPELERFFETNYVLVHRNALRIYSHRFLKIDASNSYA